MTDSDKSFWTYEGSLTTPPFYESVSWLVLKQPIKVTQAQVIIIRYKNTSDSSMSSVHITSE